MYTLYVIYINATSFVLPETVDDFWIFTEFGRSGFLGAVVSVSFLILLCRYGVWADLWVAEKSVCRMLGLLCCGSETWRMSLWRRESLSGFCNFILKFEFAVNSHFCLFLEASKDFLFRLCQSLSGSTRGNDGKGIYHAVSVVGYQ